MRRGEIVSLRWEHIDLRRRVAHLPATKKGSARDMTLSSQSVAVLQALKEDRDDADDGAENGTPSSDGRVFNIRGDAVTRAFERAVVRARKIYVEQCESAKLRPDSKFLMDLRIHDLRHEG